MDSLNRPQGHPRARLRHLLQRRRGPGQRQDPAQNRQGQWPSGFREYVGPDQRPIQTKLCSRTGWD
jgi:hypothetical protein